MICIKIEFFTTHIGVYNFTLTPTPTPPSTPPPDSNPRSQSQWTLAQPLGPKPMEPQPMESRPMGLQSGEHKHGFLAKSSLIMV